MTPKQEKFAACIADGMTQADAYRTAFDASRMKDSSIHVNASKLLSDAKVKNRVLSLRTAAIEVWLAKRADMLDDEFMRVQASLCVAPEHGDEKKKLRNHGRHRYAVFMRAGFKCQCCGAKPSADNDVVLHVDHIIPQSIGGTDDDMNLQSLCAACNMSKSNGYAYDHNKEVDLWQD